MMKEQAKSTDAGCYSIKYLDPHDNDWQLSIDYDWRTNENRAIKNQWTCAESPVGTLHWTLLGFTHDAYHVLLDHFGLEESDVSLERIVTMSPADLVHIRRAKEIRDGLVYKLIMNMRMGCPKGELADTFEAR